MRWLIGVLVFLGLLFAGPAYMYASGELEMGIHWRDADRSSMGIAPLPEDEPGPVVQVWAARAFNWRGVFAVHTWIATKEADADEYRVYEVTRWDLSRLYSTTRTADRIWYGNEAELLYHLDGAKAADLVARIAEAAARYPHTRDYRVWPGPNSNTFIAWLLREVDGLDAELPSTAIGKDYLPGGWLVHAPSGTGYQISAGGYAGIMLARSEGLELNLLGAVFGIDPASRAIKLPGIGRIGLHGRSPTG